MTLVTNSSELRVAAILAHVTIFELFERLGINVQSETTHQMWCPFHPDEHPGGSPSARVYADQNKLFCFTCQKSWDVVEATRDHFNLPFADALSWLEQEFLVPGGTSGLMGAMRTKLMAKGAPDLSVAVTMVEQTLKQRRTQLGYERYTRCLLALDLTVYEVAQKTLKGPEIQQRIQQILSAAAV